MANSIEYTGRDKWKQKATDLLNEGGGGSGTDDYNDLDNLPQINSVELKGNKTLADLGIVEFGDTYDIDDTYFRIYSGDVDDASAQNPIYCASLCKFGNEMAFQISKITNQDGTGYVTWLTFSRISELARWCSLAAGFDIYPDTGTSSADPHYINGMKIEAPVNAQDLTEGIYTAYFNTNGLQFTKIVNDQAVDVITITKGELNALEGIQGNIQTRLTQMAAAIQGKIGALINFTGNKYVSSVSGNELVEWPFNFEIDTNDQGLNFRYYYDDGED